MRLCRSGRLVPAVERNLNRINATDEVNFERLATAPKAVCQLVDGEPQVACEIRTVVSLSQGTFSGTLLDYPVRPSKD